MYIHREIQTKIKKNLFKKQTLILYGARQTGKTTLVKKILKNYHGKKTKYINCDEGDYRRLLSEAETSLQLKQIIGESKLVVLDEAQQVKNIGLKLKLLIDTFADQQIIATGSSSFDLGQKLIEPLTGRAIEFWLYPFSLKELSSRWDSVELRRRLENFLIFGNYPSVIKAVSLEEKKIAVKKIAENYLYKDILKFNNIKGSEIIQKLLQALALQLGNEVAYTELASLLGISKETVVRYIEILEKAFIIFKLRPFSRNLRKELGKLQKIYFWDLGIRNSLINNFNPLSLRSDIGALWENFIIGEKAKEQNDISKKMPLYFWRTYDQQEIDLVIEKEGRLLAYEIKWQKPRQFSPEAWKKGYPKASWQVVNRDNYLNLVLGS